MTLDVCDPRMPRVSDAYFDHFTPATMAMLCEATVLALKLGRMATEGAGLLWSAVRCAERGEAQCPVLAALESRQIEASYSKLFRPLSPPVTRERVEKHHGMNLPVVLPPRCRPDERRLDFRRTVTPGVLLAEDLARFDYTHATAFPLQQKRLDVRDVCEALAAADGFVPGPALTERGTLPAAAGSLYEVACAKAAFVGTWLVRDLHVAAAADELGNLDSLGPDADRLLGEWRREVEFARGHVAAGGCVFLVAFPGRRPWAPSACRLLGVTCAAADVPDGGHTA